MDEERCPICHEKIDPDIDAKESCELCGMGIAEPDISPHHRLPDGDLKHFCCERCKSIYEGEILSNPDLIDTLVKQRDFDVLNDYDETMKDLIITYINLKYPLADGERPD